MKVWGFLALCVIQHSTLVLAQGELQEVACEHRSNSLLQLSCPEGTEININHAVYGRQTTSVCTYDDASKMSNTNCVAKDSFTIIEEACGGKRNCSIKAANSVFGDPCKGTTKYILVDYQCVTRSGQEVACEHRSNKVLQLSCPAGTVLRIIHAVYGRQTTELCSNSASKMSKWNMKCAAHNSMAVIGEACNHKASCSIEAANSVFGDPCKGTNKYLVADYMCVVPETTTQEPETPAPLPVEPETIPEGTLGLGIRCQPHRGPKCGPANSACITYRCKCNRYWVKDGDICVEQTTLPLAARCTTPDAPCADGNSECRAYRCFCKAGTVKIGNKCEVPSGY